MDCEIKKKQAVKSRLLNNHFSCSLLQIIDFWSYCRNNCLANTSEK